MASELSPKSGEQAYVFKLKKPGKDKDETRRYGFTGILSQHAVYSGLHARTAEVFKLEPGSFQLLQIDPMHGDTSELNFASFTEMCDRLAANSEIQRDHKGRIVLHFQVIVPEIAGTETAAEIAPKAETSAVELKPLIETAEISRQEISVEPNSIPAAPPSIPISHLHRNPRHGLCAGVYNPYLQQTHPRRLHGCRLPNGPPPQPIRVPSPVAATSSYAPAYKTQVPKQAENEIDTAPTSPAADVWGGVKNLITGFVKDFNSHIADTFGDDLAEFQLSTNEPPPEKVETKPAVSKVEEPVLHPAVFCDKCLKTIRGVRHKCAQCSNYDLCEICLPDRAKFHNSSHKFGEIEKPGAKIVFKPEISPVATSTKAETLARHFATCDLCDKTIFGTRFKCLQCPDFDHCAACQPKIAQIHPTHQFVEIRDPKLANWTNVPQHKVVHRNIVCDGCGISPLVGVRFHCTHENCPDFDLCQNCEADPIARHPENHLLLKIKRPIATDSKLISNAVDKAQKLAAATSLGNGFAQILKSLATNVHSAAEQVEHQEIRPEAENLLATPKSPEFSPCPYSTNFLINEAEKENSAKEEIAPEPVLAADQTLRASFDDDVTLVDGTVVSAGAQFNKIWRVKNTGKIAWPESTRLVPVGGFLKDKKSFPVPAAAPGEAVEISCELQAPETSGAFMVHYRLQTAAGEMFGDRLWVDIKIESHQQENSAVSNSLGNSLVAPSLHASGELMDRHSSPSVTTAASVAATELTADETQDGEISDSDSMNSNDSFVVLSEEEEENSDDSEEEDEDWE